MDPITIGLIITGAIGVIKLIGAVVDRGEKATAEQAAIEQQRKLAAIEKQKSDASYNAYLQSAKDQLAADKEQAFNRATDIETETRLGFTNAMTNTYLGQLQAEMGYTDMLQQNAETMGGLTTQNALSGTKQNARVGTLIGKQMADRQDAARTQIDRTREANVNMAVGQKDIAMGQASKLRNMFNAGSTYMNAYSNRLTAAGEQNRLGAQQYEQNRSYLGDLYNQSAFNWGAMAFDTLAIAGDTFSSMVSGGLFGKSGG